MSNGNLLRERFIGLSVDAAFASAPVLSVYLAESWLNTLMDSGLLSPEVVLYSLPVALTLSLISAWLFFNVPLQHLQKSLVSGAGVLLTIVFVMHLHIEAIEAIFPERMPRAYFYGYFFG